ncbi:MAG TPA: sialidase family protein, partial [Polyangiaceae bacterium]
MSSISTGHPSIQKSGWASKVAPVLLLAVLSTSRLAHAQWEPEKPLYTNNGFYGIAAAGSRVHLIWGKDPLQYSLSSDEGVNFGAPVTLESSGELHPTGPIVAQGSDIYVVFFRYVKTATDWCCPRDLGDLYLRRSQDGGTTWQPEQRLTTSGSAFRYDLAASGSNVHLVWADYRSSDWEIYYLQSSDNGANWASEVKLVANPTKAVEMGRPQIASQGNNLHVTWEDSRDFGASCFTIPNCPEIYYKRSTDGGASWGSDVRITYDGAGGSFRPSIAAPGLSTVIIGFQSNRDGGTRSEQQVVRSIDNGGTWGSIQRMTSTAGDSEHDNLVASGSTAHLSWSEDSVDRTSHTVHYRGTWDEGAMWAPDETVSQPIGGTWSIIADLGVSTSFVHALWTDDLNMLRYARRPSGDAGAAGAGGAGGAPSNGGGGSATGGAGGVGGAGGANAQGGSSTGGGG